MLGLIFTTLVDMVEEKFSPELADEILTEANFPHGGAYTAVGYYDFDEIVTMVTLLSEKTGLSPNDLIRAFGTYLFECFTETHAHLLTDKQSLFSVLSSLDNDIHQQVLKLYNEASLPSFRVLEQSDNEMKLEYTSERHLEPLAVGLMEGAARYFGYDSLNIQQEKVTDNTTIFIIRI